MIEAKLHYGLYAFLISFSIHAVIVLVVFVGRTPPVPPLARPAAQEEISPPPAPSAMPLNASHQERLEIQSGLRSSRR